MALVPAIIQVDFTAQYTGQHRVCWRIGSSGAYDCTTLVNCTAGNSCTVNINVQVDNETCPTITFEGYVQATCQTEASVVDRIPFSVNFVPDPSCNRYVVTCDNAPVAGITVTNQGSGYDPMSPPAVMVTGGGGSGATATAVVGDGKILNTTFIFVGNPGSGYTPGSYTNVPLIGGSGSGALASVNVNGAGVIASAAVTNQGVGYQDGDILSPDTAIVGVPTVAATMTVVSDYGQVISITLNTPGTGFTSSPVVTIAAPSPGTQATADATVEDCPDINQSGCTGASVTVDNFNLGLSVAVCGTTPPVLSSQYTVVENGNCLCDCEQVSVENTSSFQSGAIIRITYVDCNGAAAVVNIPPQASSPVFCTVAGSVNVSSNNPTATWTVSTGSACSA